MIDIESLVAEKNVRPREDQGQAASWGYKPPVAMSDELRRILALPRRPQELDGTDRAEAIIERMTARFSRGNIPCQCSEIDPDRHSNDGCLRRLRLIQALALREISICGGLLGPIGVGHGKTLIDLLAPLALADVGVTLSVLLVPPGLATQLISDYEYIGQHFHMPQIIVHGTDFDNTGQGSIRVPLLPNAPIVHVVKYSLLQQPTASAWLETQLKPQAIISDEAHKLGDVESTGATRARFKRYMEDHPETKVIAVSGSMMKKKLSDYDRLAHYALKAGSPLPRDREVANDWNGAIQPSDNQADGGALLELCAPGESLMTGFRRRVAETCGVVTTTAPAIDTELCIDSREAPPIPPNILEALSLVRSYTRPDGEEFQDALQMSKCAREVACGFYYMWIFPHNVFPRDNGLIDEWREARKLFNKEVRYKCQNGDEHLDSPKLVTMAARRYHGDIPTKRGQPVWKSLHWPRWRDVKDLVKPETKAVWLSDYLAIDAAKWACEDRGRIVWYEHHTFGERVSQLGNLPMYGGGDNGGGLLDDKHRIVEDGSRSIVLSIKAHGTGRNGLQSRFHQAGIPNPPASSDGWEQVLGRLHRIGQKAPSVDYWFYKHTPELERHVKDALRAALYVEGTFGSAQKLRIGIKGIEDWDPTL